MPIVVQQAGNEKDVMDAGNQSEGENCRVDRGKIVACAYSGLRRQHDYSDGDDLDEGADFAGNRGLKRPEAGHHVDGGSAYQNKDVTADDGDGYPERNGQVLGDGD